MQLELFTQSQNIDADLFMLHFKQLPWLWWAFPHEVIWSLVTSHVPSEHSEAPAPAQRAHFMEENLIPRVTKVSKNFQNFFLDEIRL